MKEMIVLLVVDDLIHNIAQGRRRAGSSCGRCSPSAFLQMCLHLHGLIGLK
jgi:hypothetical protein